MLLLMKLISKNIATTKRRWTRNSWSRYWTWGVSSVLKTPLECKRIRAIRAKKSFWVKPDRLNSKIWSSSIICSPFSFRPRAVGEMLRKRVASRKCFGHSTIREVSKRLRKREELRISASHSRASGCKKEAFSLSLVELKDTLKESKKALWIK